jgi:polynucleotide 5'-kinase involved in rRNA processing
MNHKTIDKQLKTNTFDRYYRTINIVFKLFLEEVQKSVEQRRKLIKRHKCQRSLPFGIPTQLTNKNDVKIVVVGSYKVGKTTLLTTFYS